MHAVVAAELNPLEANDHVVIDRLRQELDKRRRPVADKLVVGDLHPKAEGLRPCTEVLRQFKQAAHAQRAVFHVGLAHRDVGVGDEIALDTRFQDQITGNSICGGRPRVAGNE